MITDPIGTSQLERHPNCQRIARGSSCRYDPACGLPHASRARLSSAIATTKGSLGGLRLACTPRGEGDNDH